VWARKYVWLTDILFAFLLREGGGEGAGEGDVMENILGEEGYVSL
jgi:hypothetical protein